MSGPLSVGSVPVDNHATSAAGCECQSSTWYETTWHNPYSWRNVRAFGAVGNGLADDTAAFRAAINFNQTTVGEKQHFVVYVPPGEYMVSDTIVLWKGTHLHGMQGPSCCRPVIRLVNHTRLFAGPLLRPVLVSTNGWGIDPKSNDWCTDNSTLGGSSNNNFQTQIQHVQLHLGANPGAVGILWKVAQQTSIRMVDIVAADAAIGLDAGGGNDYADDPGCADSLKGRFPSQSGGGTIEGVSISGGKIGLRGTGSQWLFRSVFVDGSSKVGVQIPSCWGFVFLDLQVTGTPVAVNYTAGLALSLVDSHFRAFPDGSRAAVVTQGSAIMLRNVSADDTVPLLVEAASQNGKIQVPSGSSVSWYNGAAYSRANGETGLPSQGRPPAADAGASRHLWPIPTLTLGTAVANVRDFGAVGDGVHDDTRSIQAAVDSHKTVFIPQGSYLCSETVRLPSGTQVLGEQFPMLFLASNTSGFEDPDRPKALLETDDDPTGVVQLVGLWVSAAGFDSRGQGNAGAVLISWRCGGVGAGVWDTLIATSAALWGHVVVSGGGGGVFDNVWSPGATNRAGFTAVGTSQPLAMYGTMFEHHTVVAYNIQRSRHITMLVMQTENSPLALNVSESSSVEVFGALFTDWSAGQPSLTTLSQHCSSIAIHGLAAYNTSNLILSSQPTWAVPAGFGGWRAAILLDLP